MPMNFTKTALLLAVLTGIFVAMGRVIGGQTGMVIAFGVALVMNVLSLWKSDKVVLAMQGAQEVDQSTAPEFVGIVVKSQVVEIVGGDGPFEFIAEIPDELRECLDGAKLLGVMVGH